MPRELKVTVALTAVCAALMMGGAWLMSYCEPLSLVWWMNGVSITINAYAVELNLRLFDTLTGERRHG